MPVFVLLLLQLVLLRVLGQSFLYDARVVRLLLLLVILVGLDPKIPFVVEEGQMHDSAGQGNLDWHAAHLEQILDKGLTVLTLQQWLAHEHMGGNGTQRPHLGLRRVYIASKQVFRWHVQHLALSQGFRCPRAGHF